MLSRISKTERPTKYPRTPYWPSSPAAPDDALMADPHDFLSAELVITEKLDGSNVMLHRGSAYGRSATSARQPWLGMTRKHHAWKTADHPGLQIYGEDLYGVHAIRYDPMPENRTLRLFAARDQQGWMSWEQLTSLAELLDIPTVPVLKQAVFDSTGALDNEIRSITTGKSAIGPTREGVVVRHAAAFTNSDFTRRVCKSVRAGHVQPDEHHWRRNWVPARMLPAS